MLGTSTFVVFVDYLTKWAEDFVTKDQTALTIAKLLVKQVISRHGVPQELLPDSGTAFLSTLQKDVAQVMNLQKVNTTAYRPQGDGLVERSNRTDMLVKTVDRSGENWDECLPYVLFTIESTSVQEYTQSHHFIFSMCGTLICLLRRFYPFQLFANSSKLQATKRKWSPTFRMHGSWHARISSSVNERATTVQPIQFHFV